MTEARAKRRRRALEASGILRCQWPLKAEGQDDVDETADGLWRAREDASWEALLLRLETSFAAIETEHSRQWRRVLARQKHRESRLQATLEAAPSRVPLRLRRLWWWLRLRSAGGGRDPDGQVRAEGRSRDRPRVDRGPRTQALPAGGRAGRASRAPARPRRVRDRACLPRRHAPPGGAVPAGRRRRAARAGRSRGRRAGPADGLQRRSRRARDPRLTSRGPAYDMLAA